MKSLTGQRLELFPNPDGLIKTICRDGLQPAEVLFKARRQALAQFQSEEGTEESRGDVERLVKREKAIYGNYLQRARREMADMTAHKRSQFVDGALERLKPFLSEKDLNLLGVRLNSQAD